MQTRGSGSYETRIHQGRCSSTGTKVGDCSYNSGKIAEMIRAAGKLDVKSYCSRTVHHCRYLCRPVPSDSCSELQSGAWKDRADDCGLKTGSYSRTPLLLDNQLFNCAAVVQDGEVSASCPRHIFRVTASFTRSAGLHLQGPHRATM